MKRIKPIYLLATLLVIVIALALGVFAGRFAARNVQPLQAQPDQPPDIDVSALLQSRAGQSVQPVGVDVPLLEAKFGMTFLPVDPAQVEGTIISAEEALAVAHQQKGKTKSASSFIADLGVLSNAPESGMSHSDLEEPRLVWFISFEGVATYSSCEPDPITKTCDAYVTYEYSVVIDAVTGEWISGLTI